MPVFNVTSASAALLAAPDALGTAPAAPAPMPNDLFISPAPALSLLPAALAGRDLAAEVTAVFATVLTA